MNGFSIHLSAVAAVGLLAVGALWQPAASAETSQAAADYAACEAATTLSTAATKQQDLLACLLAAGELTPDAEVLQKTRVSEEVSPLGPTPFGESVSLYNGALSFAETDVTAPGNGPAISLTRSWSMPPVDGAGPTIHTGDFASNAFVDWALDLPHLETLSAQDQYGPGQPWFFLDDTNRCSAFGGASDVDVPPTKPNTPPTHWQPETWWHGYHLVMPGAGDQDLLARDSGNSLHPAPMNLPGNVAVAFTITTKSLWAVGCLPAISNGAPGEGFLAVSPDGTKYWLDHLAWRPAQTMTVGGPGALVRRKALMLVSHAEDRFGHGIDYAYDSHDNLTSITADDGRSIAIQWEAWATTALDGPYWRIQQITWQPGTALARTWAYSYDDSADLPVLQTVTQPDGSAWHFNLRGLMVSTSNSAINVCQPTTPATALFGASATGSILHPSGLTGSFTVQGAVRARSNVPYACVQGPTPAAPTHPEYPPLYATAALTGKTFSGAGLPSRTWHYAYSAPEPSYASSCTSSCITTAWTDVTDPGGHVTRSTFSTRFDATESLLTAVAAYTTGTGSAVLRSETHSHATSGPWPATLGSTTQLNLNAAQASQLAPENQRQIIQSGTTYTWQATGFNSYAQTTKTSRDNNGDAQPALVETDSWRNDTAQWVIGQPVDHGNVNTGETVRHNVYDTDGTLKERWAFGRKLMDYTWSDGQLASFTDGNNHTTTLSGYQRGIPQTIAYPDNSQQTLTVDDLGQITHSTDELGHTTSYAYDNLGRLTQIAYPADAIAWAPKDIAYTFVNNPERGIAANHWRRTVTEGNGRTTTYYDALWQPILEDTEDTTDATSHVSSRTDYDWAGRTTLQSWPKAGSLALSSLTSGTHTTYDALGRTTQTTQDSELGTLTTSVQYQAGTKRQVTDPKGHVVTTTYQAFDQPAYDDPIQIVFSGGPTNTVSRDWYGSPTTMSQSGTYAGSTLSVTHSFGYDTYHRLCAQVSPETGKTAYGYDAADNLAWTAQSIPGTSTVCVTTPSTASKISRSYDARNRLTAIDYPTGTPDTAFSYDSDGKVHTATRGNATWTTTYYNRGLLKTDTLSIDGHSFALTYGYDAAGHTSSLKYPSGLTIAYAPDGLGRPTQAGSFATALDYSPAGMLTGLSYANGIDYVASPNTRNLLATESYGIGATPMTARSYVWDANGNLTSITDSVIPNTGCDSADGIFCAGFECGAADSIFCSSFDPPSERGTDSRSYVYDTLDRLTKLTSSRYGNDQYSYDPLGNVRSRSGDVNTTWHYDAATNRVSDENGTVPYSHDARGNVTAIGGFTLQWNLANELIGDALGTTYAYDARGWRVKVETPTEGGHTRYYLYDAEHHLIERRDNGTITDFVNLGSRPVARIENGAATYILPDYQNTPLFETDASGHVTRAPDYLAYGQTDATGIAEIPGYTGAAPDKATGLLYLGARYLHSARFLSVDPVELDPTTPNGLSRYAYANNNPVRFTDPNGEFPVAAGAAAGCAVSGPACPAGAAVGAIVAVGAGVVTAIIVNEMIENANEGGGDEPQYPTNPDDWTPPEGWVETPAGEKTGGRHRQWKDEEGRIRRRWDREGREGGKERGSHWHDADDESGGRDHIDPDDVPAPEEREPRPDPPRDEA